MNERAHLNRRKTLWKLAYATRSIQHVISACDFYLEHLKDEQPHPIAYSVMCAICVIYARPFTDNSGVGMISSKFGRYTDPRLRRTHDILLRSRMQFYAHSDPTVFATNELGEPSPMQQLRVVVKRRRVPEGQLLTYGLAHPEIGLTGIVVPDVRDACLDLQERLGAETNTVMRELFEDRSEELISMMDEDRTDQAEVVIDLEEA